MGRRLKDHCFNIDKVLENERLLETQGYYQETDVTKNKNCTPQKVVCTQTNNRLPLI